MANPPSTIMTMAMTQAKTGRFRKNLDNMALVSEVEPATDYAFLLSGPAPGF